MNLGILNHQPKLGRKTKADREFWDALNRLWENRKPLQHKPDVESMEIIGVTIGPAAFKVHHDADKVYLSQFESGKQNWFTSNLENSHD